ncbi:hypothetical protein GCM10010392_32070 [Streptomyces clavifer]|nr:hypothetical protein GCM10010392_32070 [Streptomyces clavifer]
MPRKRALSAPESQARPSLSGTAFVSLPRKSEPGDSLAAARETCGAGTTTPVSRLVGLLKPDAGAIRVAGVYAVADPATARRYVALAGPFAGADARPAPPMAVIQKRGQGGPAAVRPRRMSRHGFVHFQ